MSAGDRDFDRTLEAALRQLRERRGACPPPERLAGYLEGSLAAEERDEVQRHVAACGLCDCLLERIQGFEAPAPSEPRVDWPSAERRIRNRVFAGAEPWSARLIRLLRQPVLAYGIAVLTAVWAYLAISGRREAPPAPPGPPRAAMEVVRTIDLNRTRGETQQLSLGPDEQRFLLSFFVPIRTGFRYQAAIDGGAAVDIISQDGLGNFHVLCHRGRLSAGRHRLIVTELDSNSGRTERSFEFAFQL